MALCAFYIVVYNESRIPLLEIRKDKKCIIDDCCIDFSSLICLIVKDR